MKRQANPILIKDLRATFRTPMFVRFLYLATGAIGILVLMAGALGAGGNTPPAEVGKGVFMMFFGLAVAVVSLVAPAASSTTITGEHEGKTFESLILTGMDPARIVRGKFLANFAVFGLVIVAMSPIVGVVFLFGGVSPLRIFWAFFGLFLLLALAVAWGVAVSSRVRTTRVAIIVSTLAFQPTVLYSGVIVTLLGMSASSIWGLAGGLGPFWFADALAENFFQLDVFLLVFLLPVYLVGMAVWFFLASAVAAVRPDAEDRSTPFKYWSLAALAGQVAVLFMVYELIAAGGASSSVSFGPSMSYRDRDEVALVLQFAGVFVPFFFAGLFINEPPLPPRLWQLRNERPSTWLGPGAVGTTQAASLLILLSIGISTALAAFYGAGPGLGAHGAAALENADRNLNAVVLIGAGTLVLALAYLHIGACLRVLLKNGAAARVLTSLLLLVVLIVVYLGGALVPAAEDALLLFSPVEPYVAAVSVLRSGTGWTSGVASIVVYGGLSVLFGVVLRVQVARIAARVEEKHAERDARAEERGASAA